MPKSATGKPASLTSVDSVARFASRICPGRGFSCGSTSWENTTLVSNSKHEVTVRVWMHKTSVPVDMTPTTGLAKHSTCVIPIVASNPTSAGPRHKPAFRIVSPLAMSLPISLKEKVEYKHSSPSWVCSVHECLWIKTCFITGCLGQLSALS